MFFPIHFCYETNLCATYIPTRKKFLLVLLTSGDVRCIIRRFSILSRLLNWSHSFLHFLIPSLLAFLNRSHPYLASISSSRPAIISLVSMMIFFLLLLILATFPFLTGLCLIGQKIKIAIVTPLSKKSVLDKSITTYTNYRPVSNLRPTFLKKVFNQVVIAGQFSSYLISYYHITTWCLFN